MHHYKQAIIILGSIFLSYACSNIGLERLYVDANPDGIGKKSFEELIIGKGWRCESLHEILSDGSLADENWWDWHYGYPVKTYYFSKDSLMQFYSGNCLKSVYSFDDSKVIVPSHNLEIKILGISKDGVMTCTEYVGMKDGIKTYCYSTYRKLDKKFKFRK